MLGTDIPNLLGADHTRNQIFTCTAVMIAPRLLMGPSDGAGPIPTRFRQAKLCNSYGWSSSDDPDCGADQLTQPYALWVHLNPRCSLEPWKQKSNPDFGVRMAPS